MKAPTIHKHKLAAHIHNFPDWLICHVLIRLQVHSWGISQHEICAAVCCSCPFKFHIFRRGGRAEIADTWKLNELEPRSLSDTLYSGANTLTLQNTWALSIKWTLITGHNSWDLNADLKKKKKNLKQVCLCLYALVCGKALARPFKTSWWSITASIHKDRRFTSGGFTEV